MKKYFLLFLFVVAIGFQAFSQIEVNAGSFKEIPDFVNSNQEKQTDDNDKPYSVVKVKTENINDKQRRELLFEGNAQTFIECEYQSDAIWLYISYYATYLKISHRDFSSTEFAFPYEMKPKKGYELTLANKQNQAVNQWASLTVNTKPEDGAKVFLNGRDLNVETPYTNTSLPAGKYEIKVSRYKYRDVATTIELKDGENKTIDIDMPVIYGKLNIVSEPAGATVFIDEQEYGTTPATIDSIIIGPHDLRIAKSHRGTLKKQIVVQEESVLQINEVLDHCPDGAINGLFSVSPTKKVYFSKGNLMYKPYTTTWEFAESQWDKHANSASYYKGALFQEFYNVDLFGWGTGDNPMKDSKDNKDYATFVDWGKNAITNGGNIPDSWRTLTKDEWEYVFMNRKTASGIRFAMATIDTIVDYFNNEQLTLSIKGVIILPDNWNKKLYKLHKANDLNAKYSSNKLMSSDFKNMFEANGAIFLPVSDVGCFSVKYWAATKKDKVWVYYLGISDIYKKITIVNPIRINFPRDHCGVRLVSDYED